MEFFGMGFGEILLVVIIALIIFGPGKIPEVARTVGRTIRSLRKLTSDFTQTMNDELSIEEKKRLIRPKDESSDKAGDLPGAGTAEPKDPKATGTGG